RLHHGAATRCMHREHPDTQSGRGSHGAGNSIWNVVELEIEKHAIATACHLLDNGRATTREELAADFESPRNPAQLVSQATRFGRSVDIQCDDQLIHVSHPAP